MGQKTDNKVMKQMQNLWNQKPNRKQTLSNDEIDDMLSSDERVDKLYNMMKGKVRENKQTVKLSESQLREIIAESVKKVLAEDYYEDWKKKYEKKPRKGFDSDSVHSTIKMMTPQCQNPRKGFDSDSVHKVIKGMMKEEKWDINETLNMLGDIKLISGFLQNKYETIKSSEDADIIHETVHECLGQLWRIAQQFGYC